MGGKTCFLRPAGRRQPMKRVCFPSPYTDYRSRVLFSSWRPSDPIWLQFADLFLTRLPYVNANTAMSAVAGVPSLLKQYSRQLQSAVQKRQMVEAWRLLVREGGILPPFVMCDQLSQIIQFARGHLDAGSGNSRLAEWYHKKGGLTALDGSKPLKDQLKPGGTIFYIEPLKSRVPWVPSPYSGAKDYPKAVAKPAPAHTKIRWKERDKEIQQWEAKNAPFELHIYHSDTVLSVDDRTVEVFSTGAYQVKNAEVTKILGAKTLSGRKRRNVESIKKWLKAGANAPKYYVGYLQEATPPYWARNMVQSVHIMMKDHQKDLYRSLNSRSPFRKPGN